MRKSAAISSRSIPDKTLALVEVVAVAISILLIMHLMSWRSIRAWQNRYLGYQFLPVAIFTFILPFLTIQLVRRNFATYGVVLASISDQARVGIRSLKVIVPLTLVFPLLNFLGTSFTEWIGSLILTATLVLGFFFVARLLCDVPKVIVDERASGRSGFIFIGTVVAFCAFSILTGKLSETIMRALLVIGFVAAGEEFLCRGYMQSRLNEGFGKPFSVCGVNFGIGLFVSAGIFGLLHSLLQQPPFPWPWALWTGAVGLIFGFLREKTGGILAPIIAHAGFLMPSVFFT